MINLLVLDDGALRVAHVDGHAAVVLIGNLVKVIVENLVIAGDLATCGEGHVYITELQPIARDVSKDAALHQIRLRAVPEFQASGSQMHKNIVEELNIVVIEKRDVAWNLRPCTIRALSTRR